MSLFGRVLPNRKHIVLTRNDFNIDSDAVEVVHDLSELQEYIDDENENFLIGGATIYSLLLDKVQKMYITKINKDFDGDAYFPHFNENEWKIVEQIHGERNEKNPYDYEFITYVRK